MEQRSRYIFFILISIIFFRAQAQYTIRGKVTDAFTNEPLPYVIIQFQGTNIGAQTDFDGNYLIKSSFIKDSLKATYVGYVTRTKKISSEPTQIVNFQLRENVNALGEVVVKPGENPAWEIIRRAIQNKTNNDKRSLTGYEYESYSKMQIDIDNISKKVRNKWYMRKIIKAIDSLKKVTNDEGKPVIPLYMSETMSDIYYRGEPQRKKEIVHANKVTGVLDQTNSNFIAQIAGSTFTEFNFYENWMRFLGKDFISPIADSWKEFYEYDLEDSVTIDSNFCYMINIKPKRRGDLAFNGKIWIDKEDYALKRIDVGTGANANINFVEKIKIQQEMKKTSSGPYLTSKLRFLVDMADVGDSSVGMLVKFYVSNKRVNVNSPKELSFFDLAVEVKENSVNNDEEYWDKNRHDTLSKNDKAVIMMVDTIKRLPLMKSYIEIADIAINGYKKIGWIEVGPYVQTYAYNTVEGHRLRGGFRTNMEFSKKLQLHGYMAYGTRDDKLKYNIGIDYWFSKKKWFLIGAEHSYDLEQLSLYTNYRAPGTGLFYTFARFGKLEKRNPFYYNTSSLYSQIDIFKGITQKVQFNYSFMDQVRNGNPAYDFGYYTIPGDSNSQVQSYITNAELLFETRLAKLETFLYLDHRRLSVRTQKLPIVTLRYHLGLKGVLNSNFDYHKFSVNVYQRFTLGKFGQMIYNITGNYTPSTLPYPLLFVPLGNETPIYNPVGFSMMRFFEFINDRSVSLNLQHHFNGYFFNKIPLFNRLKWREVVSCNVLWGSLTEANHEISLPRKYRSGKLIEGVSQRMDPNVPYVDVGYGIENIFKFIRLEVYHRITYLNNADPWRNIGVKIGFQLTL